MLHEAPKIQLAAVLAEGVTLTRSDRRMLRHAEHPRVPVALGSRLRSHLARLRPDIAPSAHWGTVPRARPRRAKTNLFAISGK